MQTETNHGECLSEEMVADYLAGSLTPVVTAACEMHFVACDMCRMQLTALMRVLRTELTAAETAMIEETMQRWEQRPLDVVPTAGAGVRSRVPRWLPAVIAAAAALVILWLGWFQNPEPRSAQEIVQGLLAEERPFVPRLDNQDYLPITRDAKPQDIAQYAQLSDAMTERSATAWDWGRFYLVHKNYGLAVQSLQTAAEDPNATAGVYNDLGVAYLQQAGPGSPDRAKREFDRALAKRPDFLPAVFNLALVYELLGQPEEASEYREAYLRLDPNSQWAGEIRARRPRPTP